METLKAPPLEIYVGSTFIKFRCNRNGVLVNGRKIVYFIRDFLCEKEWIPHFRAFKIMYNYTLYEESTGMALLPRYALDTFLSWLADTNYKLIDVDPVTPSTIKMEMKKDFELRPLQEEIVDFILNKTDGFSPVSAQTGSAGKTVLSIYAIAQLKYPAIVVLGSLIVQWYKEFLKFSNLKKNDIYIVSGIDKLNALWKAIDQGYKPKIIIFALRTLTLYAVHPKFPYTELRPYNELLEKIGVGVKVIDECHMNFHANTMVDLVTNVKKNIYLSATYMRSNPQGRKIFDMVFPEALRFGSHVIKKYTVVYMVKYRLGVLPSMIDQFRTPKGYLHALYENFLLANREFMWEFVNRVLLPLMNMYYLSIKKAKQRLLILVQTRAFALHLYSSLDKILKSSMMVFFSNDPKYGNEQLLTKTDIIISTHKSSSTGRDIKGLKTCINTVSFASAPLSKQTMGRLREIPGEETIFIDLWNTEVPSHYSHQRMRMDAYKATALRIEEFTIN